MRPASYRDGMHLTPTTTAANYMHVAFSIARVCDNKKPTVQMLRDKYGMSRATAYRWVRAWHDANGVCTE